MWCRSDPLTTEIEWLTRGVRAIRITRFGEREMGRLDEKFAKAGGVVQRVEQHIETGLDGLIAREDEVKQKSTEVMARQLAPLADQMKALDALDRKLDLLSNGGPTGPLPGSGSWSARQGVQQTVSPETHTRDSSGTVIENH